MASPEYFQTKLFLQFDDCEAERDYNAALTASRLHHRGLGRVDVRAFTAMVVIALTTAARVYAAGHYSVVPFSMFCVLFFTACTALFLFEHQSNEAIMYTQRTLRVPLQAAAYFIFCSHLNLCLTLRDMADPNTCSVFWEGGVGLEALIGAFFYSALYPVAAALPFRVALPIQIYNAITVLLSNQTQCDFSQWNCPNAVQQYEGISRAGYQWLGSALPVVMPSKGDLAPAASVNPCYTTLAFAKVGINLLLSGYITYLSEISTRYVYAVQIGDFELARELEWRKPRRWQMVLELLYLASFGWLACSIGARTWFLFSTGFWG